MHRDSDQNEFYYVCLDTNESHWVHPFASYVRTVVDICKFVKNEGKCDLLKDEIIEQLKTSIAKDLDNWHGPFENSELGENGEETIRTYFVNSESNLSTWFDPREDAEVTFNSVVSSVV